MESIDLLADFVRIESHEGVAEIQSFLLLIPDDPGEKYVVERSVLLRRR